MPKVPERGERVRVGVLDDYQDAARVSADWSALEQRADVTFMHEFVPPTELAERLQPFDVLVAMRERTAFPADLLAALPRLRLLVTTGMVNAAIDLPGAAAAGVTVCGTAGVTTSTVEHTWALVLALARNLPQELAAMRDGGWQQTLGKGLDGRTLGVVGLGRLGSRVARIGAAFGMDVIAWSQNLDPEVARAAGARPVTKRELFSTADVVTVHYKLSERSTGLVGDEELSWTRPTTLLVNTSRGPVVDTPALVRALREGRLAGAALDVYDVEPLAADDPLRHEPRLLLTPHLGYVTDSGYRVFYQDAVEDVVAFLDGSPVRVLGHNTGTVSIKGR